MIETEFKNVNFKKNKNMEKIISLMKIGVGNLNPIERETLVCEILKLPFDKGVEVYNDIVDNQLEDRVILETETDFVLDFLSDPRFEIYCDTILNDDTLTLKI